jgi:DNA-binding cell septation regulator SpoVG
MPSQEKDGEWYDTIFCSKDVRGEINRVALEQYGQETPVMETNSDDIPF